MPAWTDQLRFAYQPVVNLTTGTVAALEIFARPERGDVLAQAHRSPALDVDLAALAIRHATHRETLLPLQVNLFAATAAEFPELTAFRSAVRASGRRPCEITLDLTGPYTHVPACALLEAVAELRADGFRICADGVGDGDIPLRLLGDLAPDIIKLDASLCADLDVRPGRAAVVRMVRQLCDELGGLLAVEGVETERSYAAVRLAGAQLGQGHLFAPPARRPAAEVFVPPQTPSASAMVAGSATPVRTTAGPTGTTVPVGTAGRAGRTGRAGATAPSGMPGTTVPAGTTRSAGAEVGGVSEAGGVGEAVGVTAGPPVAQFVQPAALLPVTASAEEVRSRLTGLPDVSGVLLVDADGVPVRAVDRNRFLLSLSGRYGHALYADRPALRLGDRPRTVGADATAWEVLDVIADGDRDRTGDDVAVVDERGRCIGVVHLADILRALAESRVEEAVRLNPLTRLPGSDAVNAEVDRRLAQGRAVAVSWLDVDGFKQVNDGAGFAAGDELIRAVGAALARAASGDAACRVGHIGGDDFLVLTDPDGLDAVAAAVLDVPWSAGGRPVTMSLATVVCPAGTVTGHAAAAAALAPLKKAAKGLIGASWVLSRLGSAHQEVRRGRVAGATAPAYASGTAPASAPGAAGASAPRTAPASAPDAVASAPEAAASASLPSESASLPSESASLPSAAGTTSGPSAAGATSGPSTASPSPSSPSPGAPSIQAPATPSAGSAPVGSLQDKYGGELRPTH
ncbi:GGDEF domain-containing protein [Streptomyces niger]|uniref:GGDEF domain-containing protein n=1 Tax=Streptomyces niger TaxID=66373 RepID=UPI000A84308A|nr:GGDEF domain-containing protein [Streptomyces niger]